MAKKPKKERVPNYPEGWEISTEVRVHGRILTPGSEVSIKGERGRYRFIKAVRTPTAYWLDFVGGPAKITMWRSFGPDRVKTVHRIHTTRENNKAA
jgi:hypothetical protein